MSDEPRTLTIWTLYKRPSDHPEHYVARLSSITSEVMPSDLIMLALTPEPIRAVLRSLGLTRLERHKEDQPHILEVWL